jgi:cytochrome c oxidase cbb3-type subunit 4
VSYNDLRHFADSYGLAAMAIAYLALVLWALRPSARQHHDSAASMIFTPEDEQAATNKDKSHG